MSIASAIQAAQGKVANAYTAVSNKGGTLPATQNLSNLPDAINSISGGGSQSKYGITIDAFLGDVDANGTLQSPTSSYDLVFTGVKDVGAYVLQATFNKLKIRSVSFPDLEQATYGYNLYYAFENCNNLVSCSFPKLKTVSGNQSLYFIFMSNSNLTSASFPELTSVTGSNSLTGLFSGCMSLLSVSFPKLSVITGDSACNNMFGACHKLTDAYFPALTTASFGTRTNQFNNLMFYSGASAVHTLHFPSNLESTIQGLTGYPLFGGTSGYVVCAFDLPATS